MKIYVSNLDFSIQNEELADCFATYGAVTSATVVNDRETGRSRGFGFVEMNDSTEAQTAISNLDGSTYNGRQLRAAEALDKPEKSFNKGSFRSNSSSRW